MKLSTREHQGLTLQYIKTKQFKTRILTLRFFTELNEENITARSLMLSMLKAKNKHYPTRKAQAKHLETLYDTIFHTSSTKLGTKHVNQITFVMIDDQYTLENNLFQNVVNFLKTALYEPLFDEKTLEEEKQFLKDYFQAEYTNKTRYAQKRYYEHLYQNYPYNTHALGKAEAIDTITLPMIQEAYESMLNNNQVYLNVLGDFDVDEVHNYLIKHFSVQAKKASSPILHRHEFMHVQPVKETHDVTQNRLFMTLRSDVYFRDESYFTMLVLNALLGEGSDSLLFKTVREELSLAYYVHSSYSPFTGLITLTSAMTQTAIEQGKQQMLACVDKLKAGTFTEEDLTLAKVHLISYFKQSYDSPASLSLRALRTALFKIPFKEDMVLDIIAAVTKEDIMRIAKKLELIFTYELGGFDHENESL